MESTRFHGLNVVSCEVISGGNRTPLVGVYLPLSTLYHLPYLKESLACFQEQDPIVLGYLNSDIVQAQNPCIQKVDDLLMEFSMANLLRHFRQHLSF